MTKPGEDPTTGIDLADVCRTWQDSNGHRLTITHAAAIPEGDVARRDGEVELHGMSSGCTCQAWQHNGPYAVIGDLEGLRVGSMFGYEPYPRTVTDLAPFVGRVLSCTSKEWEALEPTIDAYAKDGQVASDALLDLDDILSGPVNLALHVLMSNMPAHPATLPIVRAMRQLGHTDPRLVAAVILDGQPVGKAVEMSPDMPSEERAAYIAGIDLLANLTQDPA